MQWAFKKQLLYALSVLSVVLLIALGSWYLFLYSPPTCFDRSQNQDEEGVDCGGVCELLCSGPLVSPLWARSVRVAPGVYHAVALVRNADTHAKTSNLPYSFSLYDDKNVLIAEGKGSMFLAPGEVAPLFEANIRTDERVPVRTFVQFGQAVWKRAERPESPIRVVSHDIDEQVLRLTAVIKNETALPVKNVRITVLLYGADETLVAASQSVLPLVSAREEREVIFTWQEPFTAPIVTVDIIPRIDELP